MDEQFISTSTLVPMLLLWSAALGMRDAYTHIRDEVIPAMPKTTLNFWSADAGYDGLVADPVALHAHGVGEGVLDVPADPAEFLTRMAKPLGAVQPIEDFPWYRFRVPYIPLLTALHWRLQVPREMLVKHAMAVTADLSQALTGDKAAASDVDGSSD
jgi:hypothetical protein